MYMLKSVGDSTPPCGTPFLNWRCVDVLFLNVVYALSSATVIVRSGGLFWLKPVAMVLLMLFFFEREEDLLKSTKILYTIEENKDISRCNKI